LEVIFLTGTNSFVGKSLCRVLVEQRQIVRTTTRQTKTKVKNNETLGVGELNSQSDWTKALLDIK
jgi:nucleoside-diphosphate-sugar epimerase